MDKLNVLRPVVISKATEHIQEQIELVQKLVENGIAYDTPEAVYFDTTKFDGYGKILGQADKNQKVAARDEVKTGDHKKNPADFSLWFKRKGRFAKHAMHWDSPWGDGFPGWHVECSAMSMKYLGTRFDIHTGGEDHLAIHHPNEIAQSEGASGKSPFVRFWVHHAFLKIDGKKMSKSLGNLYTVGDVEKKNYDPLSLRYLYLTAHYRDPMNFTWDSLTSAQNAYDKLKSQVQILKADKRRSNLSSDKLKKVEKFQKEFDNNLADDLNTAKALALVWAVIKSNITSEDKYDLLLSFDEVLGLDLRKVSRVSQESSVPDAVKDLLQKREEYRKIRDYKRADETRKKIEKKGFIIKDTKKGPSLVKQ